MASIKFSLHARQGCAWSFPAAASLVAAGIWATTPVQAMQAKLSAPEAQKIVASGEQQAKDTSHGYVVADYVLYDRKDPLRISPEDTLVDAVIVGTPREQLLYEGYLNAFQGKTLSVDSVQKLTDKVNDTLDFRVFAHASSAKQADKDFLSRFSSAKLTLDTGTTLTAVKPDIFGPSKDFFIVNGNGHEFRWLGSVTYHFDLSGLAKMTDIASMTGKLSFTDSSGHDYNFEFDLSKYD